MKIVFFIDIWYSQRTLESLELEMARSSKMSIFCGSVGGRSWLGIGAIMAAHLSSALDGAGLRDAGGCLFTVVVSWSLLGGATGCLGVVRWRSGVGSGRLSARRAVSFIIDKLVVLWREFGCLSDPDKRLLFRIPLGGALQLGVELRPYGFLDGGVVPLDDVFMGLGLVETAGGSVVIADGCVMVLDGSGWWWRASCWCLGVAGGLWVLDCILIDSGSLWRNRYLGLGPCSKTPPSSKRTNSLAYTRLPVNEVRHINLIPCSSNA